MARYSSIRTMGCTAAMGVLGFILPLLPVAAQGASSSAPPVVTVKVVQGGESTAKAEDLRQVIVSGTVNPPDPFPGWQGAVAWNGATRLKDGTLLMVFDAGYWHVSVPTGSRMAKSLVDSYYKLGMPRGVYAPTGSKLMITRSEDGGRTWSKPKTLADTPHDDRQGSLLELPDGTVLCSFFTSDGEWDPMPGFEKALAPHVMIARSTDGGRTWGKAERLPQPYLSAQSDGPMTLLKDGSILLTEYGYPASEYGKPGFQNAAAFLRSTDNGKTWRILSTLAPRANSNLDEDDTAQLPDGRLVMIARDHGDISWSSDGGHTWSPPVNFGMPVAAPTLYMLQDGTLLCLYASGRALRAIFSTDGGTTWIAPDPHHGFTVDGSVYGYSASALLPDGSVYVTYQRTPEITPEQVKNQAILAVRMRVRPDHSGIDLLPFDPDVVLGKKHSGDAK